MSVSFNYNRPALHSTIPTPVRTWWDLVGLAAQPPQSAFIQLYTAPEDRDTFTIGDETFQFIDVQNVDQEVDNSDYIAVYLDMDLIFGPDRCLSCIKGIEQALSRENPTTSHPGWIPTKPGGGAAKKFTSRKLKAFAFTFVHDSETSGSYVWLVQVFNGSGSTFANMTYKGGADQLEDFSGGEPDLVNVYAQVFLGEYEIDEFPSGNHSISVGDAEGVVSLTLQADADERNPQEINGVVFQIELTPELTSTGLMKVTTLVTPVLGNATNSENPTSIYTEHPQNMDTWQTQRGRARQDYLNSEADLDQYLYDGHFG